METDSFINILRRFLARRGPVRQLRSDQGTNLVGARIELKEALNKMDCDEVRQFLVKKECDWIEFKFKFPVLHHIFDLVCSRLSYASKIWAFQSCIREMRLLESVQRQARRFILNCSKDLNIHPNYKSRLMELNLLPLSYGLECRDLYFMPKYLNGGFDVKLKDFVKIASGQTRNSTDTLMLYPVHQYRTSLFRDSFVSVH